MSLPPIQTGNAAIPASVQAQLDQIIRWLSEIYDSDLLGIYLHGSLAMGCFNLWRSDLDVLVVTRTAPSRAQFDATAHATLTISRNPIPLEISLCHYAQLHPWRYPPPFDFHFSEIWRTRMEAQAAGATGLFALERVDPDLAAHCMVTRRRGARLYGVEIADAIPEPPWADYLDAIDGDLRDAMSTPLRDPVYAVLNACRVWAAHGEHLVLSKVEGAAWAMNRLAPVHQAIVSTARDSYTRECTLAPLLPEQVLAFLNLVREQL